MKPKTSICLAKKIAIAAIAAFAVLPTMAADYYWIGGNSEEWATGSNWSLTDGGAAANAYPGASDAATFGGNASITLGLAL